MKGFILFLCLLISTVGYAAPIALFEPGGKFLKYRKTANTNKYLENPNAIIFTSIPILPDGPQKYWKRSGNSIVRMNLSERNAVNQALKTEKDNQERSRIDLLNVSTHDLLIALIKRINVRIPGNPITKQEVITQILVDSGL